MKKSKQSFNRFSRNTRFFLDLCHDIIRNPELCHDRVLEEFRWELNPVNGELVPLLGYEDFEEFLLDMLKARREYQDVYAKRHYYWDRLAVKRPGKYAVCQAHWL